MSAVTTEIQSQIEPLLYRTMNEALRTQLASTAESSTQSLTAALIAALGAPAILELAGVSSAGLAGGLAAETIAAEIAFVALFGRGLAEFIELVVKADYNRKGSDGKQLRDRLRSLAQSLGEELAVTLRESIRKGDSTAAILRKVERVFTDNDWRLDRITESESLTAYRTAVAKAAEANPDLIRGLRIIDFPHGDPAEHKRHECYVYARADVGLGRGVYPVSTQKIRNPHPMCRSVLIPVLNEGGGTT